MNMFVLNRVFSLGAKVTSETYITGTRRFLINKSVQICSYLILLIVGMQI